MPVMASRRAATSGVGRRDPFLIMFTWAWEMQASWAQLGFGLSGAFQVVSDVLKTRFGLPLHNVRKIAARDYPVKIENALTA